MAKYIIDIPDDRIGDFVGSTSLLIPYTIAGHKRHHVTELDLTPYTEPDRKAIDLQYARDIENVAKMNYDEGAKDAWEFAKTVSIMKPEDKRECWGTDKYNTINLGYSYQEAKAKYEAWKKQKDEIRVGDEVEYECCGEVVKFIVTGVIGSTVYGFKSPCDYDDVGEYCDIEDLRKTGRHFDEVAELLEKMRERETSIYDRFFQ